MIGWVLKLKSYLGPNVYPEAPDGGWGWVVALAFFLVEVCTYGVIKSFGVFLQDLTSDFGESNSRVSWIVSICVFVMTFTAPLASVLSNRFGYQPVVILGGCLISLGTITTAFTSSINEMYVTIGLVSGLGYCFTFLPTITVLSQYFSKRRSLVTAMASTGESLSIFAFAPAFTALKEQIGWRHCLVVVGVLQVSIIFCGVLLRPIIIEPTSPKSRGCRGSTRCPESTSVSEGASSSVEQRTLVKEEPVAQPQPPAKSKLLDFSILKDCGFILYSLFGLFATLGFFAPQLYVIELSVSRGIGRERAAFMLSTMAVAEMVGRLSIGWVLSRKGVRKIYVLLGSVSLLCAVLLSFPFATNMAGLVVCCVLYGFLFGTIASTHIPMLAEEDVVGVEKMSSAAGVYVFLQSFSGLAGPPLGGFLVDHFHDYGAAFYSCGVGMGIGAFFLCLVRPAKSGRRCTGRRTPELEQNGGINPPQDQAAVEDLMEVKLDLDVSPGTKKTDDNSVL